MALGITWGIAQGLGAVVGKLICKVYHQNGCFQ